MTRPATPGRGRRQSGSVVVTAAIAMSLIVIALIGTELGYLFFLKREFQKSADLAALAGTTRLQAGGDCAQARAAAIANAGQNLPPEFTLTGADISCGRWDPATRPAAPHFGPAASTEPLNAVQVDLARTPALLLPGIPGNLARNVRVQALAAQRSPQAALNIRSSLLTVDSSKSAILNGTIGGLLGGNVTISAAGYNGLIATDVNLLAYLDQLALDFNLGAGGYDQVLQTDATVGQLLNAMATVLQRNGSTAQVTLDALSALAFSANMPTAQPLLKLGELVKVQTGTPAAGLDTNLQVFQLVQGAVQLANGKGAIAANLPVNVLGMGTATLHLKIIEPPQLSAIGDPTLAALDPDGPNGIRVRTAQFRALLTLDLPLLTTLSSVTNAVANLLTPVTSLLNNVLSLNLQGIVGSILCFSCTQTQVVAVPEPVRLSVYLDGPSSTAKVVDVDCSSAANKELGVRVNTSASSLQVGNTTPADEAAAMGNGAMPSISAIPVLDTNTRTCTTIVFTTSCAPWAPYSRTGLKADTSIAAMQTDRSYANPPEIDQAPAFQNVSSTNVIASLEGTLNGLQMQTHRYSATATNHFGNLVGGATDLVNAASTAVKGLVTALLAPMLDSLLNAVLSGLGIQLATADVGARLSCARGVELVF
jgi:uncharacterized membrane protein